MTSPVDRVGVAAAAHFANDAVTSMFPALLPALALRLELNPAELAFLAGAFALSTSLPQPVFGWVADRVGRSRVGAVGLAVTAALIAGLSLAPSPSWLWLAVLAGGLGSSAVHPAGLGLARAASPTNPGLAVAFFSSAGMAGGALGPLLAVGVVSAWGLERLTWLAVPVALVAALLGRRQASLASAPREMRRTPRRLDGRLAWLAAIALLANLVMLAFTTGIPVWLVAERGLSATHPLIGLTLAVFSVAAAASGFVGSALVRRYDEATLIVGSLGLSAVALEGTLLAAPGSVPYLAAVAGSGALLGLHGPLLIARAQTLVPGAESAVAGLLLGGTTGVAGIAYAGLGVAQARLGVGSTLAAVGLLVLPAAHLAWVVLRPRASEPSCDCLLAGVGEPGCCY